MLSFKRADAANDKKSHHVIVIVRFAWSFIHGVVWRTMVSSTYKHCQVWCDVGRSADVTP